MYKLSKYLFNKYTVSLYVLLLILSMALPFGNMEVSNPIGFGELGDYIAHFIVFLPWMFAGFIVWGKELKQGRWFLLGTVLVAALELIQLALPYRGYNIYDMLIGEIGLIFSYISLVIFMRCGGGGE